MIVSGGYHPSLTCVRSALGAAGTHCGALCDGAPGSRDGWGPEDPGGRFSRAERRLTTFLSHSLHLLHNSLGSGRYKRYICDMDLNVRNFPEGLLRQLKSEAAASGRTLRELVIDKCAAVAFQPKAYAEYLGDGADGTVRVRREVRGRRAPKPVPAEPGSTSDLAPLVARVERPGHAENCRCLMCKPPKVE